MRSLGLTGREVNRCGLGTVETAPPYMLRVGVDGDTRRFHWKTFTASRDGQGTPSPDILWLEYRERRAYPVSYAPEYLVIGKSNWQDLWGSAKCAVWAFDSNSGILYGSDTGDHH